MEPESEKTVLYITETHFADLRGAPIAGVLTDFSDESKFDQQIRGWTQYWNDIFKLSDPLDPNLVKALIATESSFKIKPREKTNAYGLMQIRSDTLGYLCDTKGELKNYLIRISKNELLDTSANICAGIRWLFRKKETASSRLGREATWFETVEDYKSVLKKRLGKEKYNLELMKKFHEYYKPLQEAQNKALDR